MRNRNTLLGAEQSRAEQSRAEQSRAEQSRAEADCALFAPCGRRAEQSRAEQSRAEQRLTAPFLRPAAARRMELNTIFEMDNRRT